MLGNSNCDTDLYSLKNNWKEKGGFEGIKKFIKQELNIEKDTFKTWNGLIRFINLFNQTFERRKDKNNQCNNDNYFTSTSNKYIFALVELDGKPRAKLLGITKEHYSNKELAKEWQRNIAKQIHPDKCKHGEAQLAMSKLNSLYEGMKKYGE